MSVITSFSNRLSKKRKKNSVLQGFSQLTKKVRSYTLSMVGERMSMETLISISNTIEDMITNFFIDYHIQYPKFHVNLHIRGDKVIVPLVYNTADNHVINIPSSDDKENLYSIYTFIERTLARSRE